jgi:hypothetical protein
MTNEEFRKFISKKRNWYKNIGRIHCPILNEYVIFNSKGFYHLRYDTHNKERTRNEQVYKLNLLPLVISVIQNAVSIFEYKKEQYSKPLGKYFEIWELREVSGKKHPTVVSVVLRRIGDGNITFLSVYDHKIKPKRPSLG